MIRATSPLRDLATTTFAALRRFPLVLCSATLATCAGLLLLELQQREERTSLQNVALVDILGIPLLLALGLTAERRRWGGPGRAIAACAGLAALIVYAFSLPGDVARAPTLHL